MKKRLLLTLVVAISGLASAMAYDPDASNIKRVGNYIYELQMNGERYTGYASLIDVKEGYQPTGEITIPGSVTIDDTRYVVNTIGARYEAENWFEADRAFKDFPGITRVNIPSTISSIGSTEFIGCTGINEFHVNAANEYFKDLDGVLLHRFGAEASWRLFRMPPARPKTKYTLPDEVYYMDRCAFADNKSIKLIIMNENGWFGNPYWAYGNNGIREIDVSKSSHYKSVDGIIYTNDGILAAVPPRLALDSFVVPASCREIGMGAFCNTIIPEVTIHDKCDIGHYAFSGSAIKTLKYNGDAVAISPSAVCLLCPELTEVRITGTAAKPLTIERYAFALCPKLSKVELSSVNTTVNMGAFLGCTALEEFPFEKVKNMEGADFTSSLGRQFEGSGLTDVKWPGAVAVIPPSCFQNCVNLAKVSLNDFTEYAETSIRQHAFDGCTALERIQLSAVDYVQTYSFDNCPLLNTIYIPSRSEKNEILIFGAFAFHHNTRVYINTPYLKWGNAYGSHNNYPATFICSNVPGEGVPMYWEKIYCAAGTAGDYTSRVCNAPVVEMFTLWRSSEEGAVRCEWVPEIRDDLRVSMVDIFIDDEEAEKDEATGLWRVKSSKPALESTVKVRYLIDSEVLISTYAPKISTGASAPSVAEPKSISGVYNLSGVRVASDPSDLPSGCYIITYTDGTSSKLIR